MSKIIIDQILKFFEKSKNWILSGEKNAQMAKDNIPKIPVIVAQKTALLNHADHSSAIQSDMARNVTSGVTFHVRATDQTVMHSKKKYTTFLKRAKKFSIGSRGRGRGA